MALLPRKCSEEPAVKEANCTLSNQAKHPGLSCTVLAWEMLVWWDVPEALGRRAEFESGLALTNCSAIRLEQDNGPQEPPCINTGAIRTIIYREEPALCHPGPNLQQ